MAPKLVDVDQKKKEIIEATLQVLAEKGVDNLRIVDISDRLDIGKSTIYEYFDNKDEILKQALEYFLQILYIPDKNDNYSFLDEIKSVLGQFNSHTEDELKQFNVILDIFYHGIKGDFPRMEDVYTDYINYLADKISKDQSEGIIRRDIDPKAVASWVGGTLDGIGIQLLLKKDKYQVKDITSSFMQALEAYLQNK